MSRIPFFLIALLGPSAAIAQADATSPTLTLSGLVGFAGTVGFKGQVAAAGMSQAVDDSEDMGTTYGAELHFDAPVHRNISLGAIARLSWWKADSDLDRTMSGDLLGSVRLRKPFPLGEPGEWCILFLQFSGGIGASKLTPPDDGLAKYTVHADASPVLGADVGMQFLLSHDFGIIFTMGAVHREMPMWATIRMNGMQARADATVDTTQFVASFGLSLVL